MSTTYSNPTQALVPTIGGTQQYVTVHVESELMNVLSSCIAAAEFWPDSGSLFVQFANSDVYRYDDVEYADALNLEGAASAGRYFNEHIKGVYPHEKC